MNGNIDTEESERGEQEPTSKGPLDWRMVVLGVYLFLILTASVYFLAGLMLADTTDSGRIGDTLATCRNANTNSTENIGRSPANASDSDTRNINTSSTSNANAANANANSANANSTSANTTNVNSAKANSNNNANGAAASKGNTQTSDTSNTTNTNSNRSTSDRVVTIPKIVKLDAPGFLLNYGCLTSDGYLFLLVLLAGMVGASIRGLYSFILHLGRRDFGFNWIWYYILLPYFGGALSLVLYFVIRGGFYSNSLGKDLDLNVFSFAALAALTGLFSDQALAKLKLVAESLLTKTEPKTDQPAIAALTIAPSSIALNDATRSQQLKVTALDAQNKPIPGISPDALRWTTENGSVATVDSKGTVTKASAGSTNVQVTTSDNKIVSNKCTVTCT